MDEIDNIIKIIQSSNDEIESRFGDLQKKALSKIISEVKNISTTKRGTIEPTTENLKRITNVVSELNKVMQGDEFDSTKRRLDEKLTSLSDAFQVYAEQFKDKIDKAELQNKMALMSSQNSVVDNYIRAGISGTVAIGVRDILKRSVISGMNYSDMVDELQNYIKGKDGDGAVLKYAKTYITTALSQRVGEFNAIVAKDIETPWFTYRGSLKETSRPFCQALVDLEYVHKSQFPDLLKGKIGNETVPIYPKTGLPAGMIDGTNETNLIVNRGGWNCDHAFYPVPESSVPQWAKDALLSQGIKPDKSGNYNFKTKEEAIKTFSSLASNCYGIEVDADRLPFGQTMDLSKSSRYANHLNKLTTEYDISGVWGNSKPYISLKTTSGYYGAIVYNSRNGQMVEMNFGDRTSKVYKKSDGVSNMDKSTIDEKNHEIQTMTHEFGHTFGISGIHSNKVFSNLATDKTERYFKEANKIFLEYKKEVKSYLDPKNNVSAGGMIEVYMPKTKRTNELFNITEKNNKDLEDMYLGHYAMTDVDEFIAESFKQYKLSENPTKYAIKIGELIDKNFKRK